MDEHERGWVTRSSELVADGPWIRLRREQLVDDQGAELEWWRIERDDSLLVVATHQGDLLLPPPAFRPGIRVRSLDLPGGRLRVGADLERTAIDIVERELGVKDASDGVIRILESDGLAVDSSSSDQLLFAALLELPAEAVPRRAGVERVPLDEACLGELASRLRCVQCRAALELARAALR